MAVIEIAKIQVRRGQENQTGIPQLDGGEFAWAADTEKLYIGLRREDGGSRDDNVEILTENHLANLFSPGIVDYDYTYMLDSTSTVLGASGITAEDGTDLQVIRPLQDRLDETVSVQSFGVYGNGVDWDLRKLQLAIDRLFLNTGQYDPHPAKKLYFPAGTYNITGTVYIPANTHLIGDGPNKTVFVFSGSTSSAFKTMDLKSVNGTVNPLHFDSGSGLGADFETTSSAKNVYLEDFSIVCDPINTTVTQDLTLVSLDCADDSLIRNIEFVGNLDFANVDATTSTYVALAIRGKPADGTNFNTIVDDCTFRKFYNGVVSNHDIKGTIIKNSKFYELNKGINFNDPIDAQAVVGPYGVRILDNYFDLVRQQGIYVGNNFANTGSYIVSQRNIFDRVAYDEEAAGDVSMTATSIISFISECCSSIDDHFNRKIFQDTFRNTVDSTTTYYPLLIDGRTSMDSSYVTSVELQPTSATSILRIPITGSPQHLNVKYNVFQEGVATFSSTLTVAVNAVNTVTLNSVEGIGVGVAVSGTIILTTTTVVEIDFVTNEVTLDQPVTGTDGDELFFDVNLDRMGVVSLYLQSSEDPQYILNDDYNYITAGGFNYDGGVSFGVEINPDNSYYNVIAVLNELIGVPVTMTYQTKLMI